MIMNREIKFRAWDKGAKRMYDNVMTDGLSVICKWDIHHSEEDLIFDPTIYSFRSDKSEALLLMVLMQYTGLKDKNGKEIYEGDIFSSAWPTKNKFINEVIVFKDGCFWMYTAERTNSDILNYPDGCWPLFKYNTEMWLEVIGNIYQNPELLK